MRLPPCGSTWVHRRLKVFLGHRGKVAHFSKLTIDKLVSLIKLVKYIIKRRFDMTRRKMNEGEKVQFQNVGLIKEDHDLLRQVAASEQRSMARQLSVLIRRAVAEMEAI